MSSPYRTMPNGATETDPSTGTRRLELSIASAEGGSYGDLARGNAWSGRYVSDDGAGCADVEVYPVLAEWGWDVVIQTTAGDVELPDCPGCDKPVSIQDDATYPWTCNTSGCENEGTWFTPDDFLGGHPRPADSAEIEYEYPHPFDIDSLRAAQKIADRLGKQDYSFCLTLRKQKTSA